MKWERSNTIALGNNNCVLCGGLGLTKTAGDETACRCVLREIFRVCHRHFRHAVLKPKTTPIVKLDRKGHQIGRPVVYGLKDEEFCGDFVKISRRHLTPDEWRIFAPRYLQGADSGFCAKTLGIPGAKFRDQCRGIEEKLGLIFATLEPFPLWPIGGYYADPQRGERVHATNSDRRAA
jgi:hypothetical protein